MRSNWPFEKHFPGIFGFQALSRCGRHWSIHAKLNTMLLTASTNMAACKGLMKAFETVIRRSNKQIEILVNVNVAKV